LIENVGWGREKLFDVVTNIVAVSFVFLKLGFKIEIFR